MCRNIVFQNKIIYKIITLSPKKYMLFEFPYLDVIFVFKGNLNVSFNLKPKE